MKDLDELDNKSNDLKRKLHGVLMTRADGHLPPDLHIYAHDDEQESSADDEVRRVARYVSLYRQCTHAPLLPVHVDAHDT